MSTKTIKTWINGAVQEIEVEDIVTTENEISVEDRLNELEDKPIIADGNFLVGNGTEDYVEMTPAEVLSHINGASVTTLTTEEYNALEETNANTLYMLTDSDEDYVTEEELLAKGYLTSDSLNGLASTDYVDTAVAGIVNSAPEALNTLNELASALGNDENFAATVSEEIGKKVDKVTGKGLSTNDYTTTEKTNLQTLWDWYQAETYEVMTGSLSMSPSTTTYEMGSSQSVTFSWTFSKLPTEVKFNNVTQTAAQSGSSTVTVTSSEHTTLTYPLYGKYVEGETVNASKSIYFRNKYYYGYKAIPTTVNSDFIKGLGNSGWAHDNTIDFTSNCASGTYIWYAYPKRLGTSQMWMGGFQGGFEEPLTVSVTNSSGYTEDYYVYRSTNSGVSLYIEAK